MNGGNERRESEDGREDSAPGGSSSTEGGQRPTSNVQRSTSKDQGERRGAYDLEERILAYAVRVVRIVDLLPKSRGGDHLGGQLLRSGTSPALNHGEAQAAESRNDFVHKMRICLKELRESRRTLRIIQGVPLAKDLTDIQGLIDESEELIRIFFTAVRTALSRGNDKQSGNASRIREDASAFGDTSAGARSDAQLMADADPITGAQPWTLDVERWTLDVEKHGSTSKEPSLSEDSER